MPKGVTDKRLRRHLRALTAAARLQANQETNRSRTAIGVSSKVIPDPDPEPVTQSIASPLIEFDVSARTFHPEAFIVSTDALFALSVTPVNKITLTDANEIETEFVYGDPFNP